MVLLPSGDIPATKADINVSLVGQWVTAQFPQWVDLPIKPVEFDGWDNRTFRLGEEIRDVARELGATGLTGSVTVLEDLQRLVEVTLERHGRIDPVVNNTGHPPCGGLVGEEFRQLFQFANDDPTFWARLHLAELGIGTNPNARQPDNVLEAEKIKGTVHIGIGENIHMGGLVEADSHEDFVQARADLILDGKPVIVSGEWRM